MVASYVIPETMMAAVIEAPKKIVVKRVPVPKPAYGEVLIKVMTSGVCHSDLHVLDGGWEGLRPSFPLIPGHEACGVVCLLGEGVAHLKLGDRVGLAFLHDSCLACEHCLAGWETLCPHQHQSGFVSDGGMAEYCLARSEFVGHIPKGLSNVQAAPILCAGVTTYKGLKETKVAPGQWVAIHGASGGLGHLAIQYAKFMGMKVLAIDFGSDRVNFCLKTGADAAIDAKEGDVVEKVKAAVPGGPHGVLIVAPALQCYEQAVKYVRTRGTVVGIALPTGDFKVNAVDMILGAKTIKGSIVGTRLDLQESLLIAGEGTIHSNVYEDKLENIAQIFDDLQNGRIKGRCVLRIAPDEE